MKVLWIALAVVTAQAALAAYPDRAVKVLMPFPPGGTVDLVTRLVCNEASELLGKPLVLDYRPGAAGIIASEALAVAESGFPGF
jgi:tripartite-type tricarboxylate transporter receptor subunit TctC